MIFYIIINILHICIVLKLTKYRNGEQISGTQIEKKGLNIFCEEMTERSIVGTE